MLPSLSRFYTFYRLCRQAFRGYLFYIVVLTALGFVSGILGGIGINTLLPLFSFIGVSVSGVEDNFITVFVKKIFSLFGLEFSVIPLLVFISGLLILKNIVFVLSSYFNLRLVGDYEEKLRNRLFSAMLESNWPRLLKEKLGHLHTILMVNTQYVSSILGKIGGISMVLVSLIVYITVALIISLSATVFTVLVSFLLFFAFRLLVGKIQAVSRTLQVLNRNISHHVNESVLGMKIIKIMAVEAAVAETGRQNFRQLKEGQLKIGFFDIISGSMLEPLSLILICAVFVFFYRSANFNFAAVVAVIYLIKQIFAYVEQLQKKIFSLAVSIPYLENIIAYENKSLAAAERINEGEPFKFEKSLQFKGVNFFYDSVKRPVLSQIDFEINKGQMVGLIGPSGAGKTTVVDLFMRLFEPSAGEIIVDGRPISEISLSAWRRKIGYVSQDIFLINDTIFNNIKLYDQTISEKDVLNAAKQSNVDDFVMSLPIGFQTIIGDRGILLSAGQRQRIAIARVLARRPEILILDEATSALDNESEFRIQEVIDGLRGKITVLIIAHRLSTIMVVDSLIVLNNGVISEIGRPAELIRDQTSYFYKMYHLRK